MSSAVKPTYSSYTYDSPNGIKRLIHRKRYSNVLKGLGITKESRILDFGCGDGRLFRVLLDQGTADPANLIGFDPVPDMQVQFGQLVPESTIVADSRQIPSPKQGEEFDFLFCCEVLEHLTPHQTAITFAEFQRLGSSRTKFIIEVPIEIGLFGALKNIYRRVASGVNIPWSLIAKSLFGMKIQRSPRITSSGHETFDHPGYSFKQTKKELLQFMRIAYEFNDPFRRTSFILNNSHIFVAHLTSEIRRTPATMETLVGSSGRHDN